jgi:UDP-glucuronate decarboxylase
LPGAGRVTGGAGFLGSHLCERLLARGHDVLCVDNFSPAPKPNAHLLGNPNFELMRHDVTFPLYVEVDEIYNLACPASPIHYQFDPVQTTKTSVHGAINMLGLAKRVKAKIFQASTSEVYGDPRPPAAGRATGATSTPSARACYDEGKRCAETLFFDYHRQHGCASRWRGSSTPTGRACTPTTAGWSPTSSSRPCAANPSRSTATAARPVLLLRGRPDRGLHPPDGHPDEVTGPVNLGNPGEFTILAELAACRRWQRVREWATPHFPAGPGLSAPLF